MPGKPFADSLHRIEAGAVHRPRYGPVDLRIVRTGNVAAAVLFYDCCPWGYGWLSVLNAASSPSRRDPRRLAD